MREIGALQEKNMYKTIITMLTDNLTNTVFLSNWLPKECPELYMSLTKTLRDNAVDYQIVGNTNDIWCRDYMPIQTEEKRFLSYKYFPDYLVKKT